MRKLRWAMIGGGIDSMIGPIHRYAARLDGQYELVAGAFSKNHAKSLQLGNDLGLPAARVYTDFEQLISGENNLAADKRAEVITIVTPNYLHHPIAELALAHGFHTVIDKPVTCSLDQAVALKLVAEKHAKNICVTHTFTGYAMVKQAREIILNGKLGKIRKIQVNFSQGWLSPQDAKEENKQAAWRLDPAQSGMSTTMADIGIHAFYLTEYISNLKVESVRATLNTLVPGRILDDDGIVELNYAEGSKGTLIATQIAAGEKANLKISIHAEKGSLSWQHLTPHELTVQWLDKPTEILQAGHDNKYLPKNIAAYCRTPAGHPEGYIEAFANIYRDFADYLLNVESDRLANQKLNFPTIDDGIRGMKFVEACLQSQHANSLVMIN